jgi:UDP-glucose 4-epimerase
MNKNIAIIGGTGFIGSNFINNFQNEFSVILCISQSEEKFNSCKFNKNVKFINKNLSKEDLIAELSKNKIHYLLDLAYASVPKTSFIDPVSDIHANLISAVNMLEIASSLNLEKFIWTSSGGTVYGNHDSTPIAETESTDPISPYGITKLAIEKYANIYYHTKSLPVVCLRPSNAFGPRQLPYRGQGFIGTAIASILDEKKITIFGPSGKVRDYIFIDDLCNAIMLTIKSGVRGEIYNIGSGIGYNNMEIIEKLKVIAKEDNYKVEVIHENERPFDVSHNILNCEKFKSHTGWVCKTDFNEALRITWDWYKANNYNFRWLKK